MILKHIAVVSAFFSCAAKAEVGMSSRLRETQILMNGMFPSLRDGFSGLSG
jgi:hypothetical protein